MDLPKTEAYVIERLKDTDYEPRERCPSGIAMR